MAKKHTFVPKFFGSVNGKFEQFIKKENHN